MGVEFIFKGHTRQCFPNVAFNLGLCHISGNQTPASHCEDLGSNPGDLKFDYSWWIKCH